MYIFLCYLTYVLKLLLILYIVFWIEFWIELKNSRDGRCGPFSVPPFQHTGGTLKLVSAYRGT